jgi:hypothetical protein
VFFQGAQIVAFEPSFPEHLPDHAKMSARASRAQAIKEINQHPLESRLRSAVQTLPISVLSS